MKMIDKRLQTIVIRGGNRNHSLMISVMTI